MNRSEIWSTWWFIFEPFASKRWRVFFIAFTNDVKGKFFLSFHMSMGKRAMASFLTIFGVSGGVTSSKTRSWARCSTFRCCSCRFFQFQCLDLWFDSKVYQVKVMTVHWHNTNFEQLLEQKWLSVLATKELWSLMVIRWWKLKVVKLTSVHFRLCDWLLKCQCFRTPLCD